MIKQKWLVFWVAILFTVSAAGGQNELSWADWTQQLRQEAMADGIRAEVFDRIFSDIPGPDQTILRFYNSQPERRLTFLEYQRTRADNLRIETGRQERQKYNDLLSAIDRDYGVDPAIVLALWGLETNYGQYLGSFSVPQSLATLAYGSNRPEFFRSELLKALHILQDGQVSLPNFKGEWAGASGHPQFLPSSWYKYAVDYDHCGRKDIWTRIPDALASIANYLAKNGWQPGQPWAVEVSLPDHFDSALIGKSIIKPVSAWRDLGVTANNHSWPDDSLPASIIQLNGGPTLMIFKNFRVLQTWNDSNYYVATVVYLADQIE